MRVRDTARVIVLDEHARVLLFRYEDAVSLDPARPDLRVYWGTPGGGLEAGETFIDAARRELWEETGIRDAVIGAWLWTREKTLVIRGETVHFHERYFLVRVTGVSVNTANMVGNERFVIRAHHWWTLAELRTTEMVILPPDFAKLLDSIIAGQLSEHPFVIA